MYLLLLTNSHSKASRIVSTDLCIYIKRYSHSNQWSLLNSLFDPVDPAPTEDPEEVKILSIWLLQYKLYTKIYWACSYLVKSLFSYRLHVVNCLLIWSKVSKPIYFSHITISTYQTVTSVASSERSRYVCIAFIWNIGSCWSYKWHHDVFACCVCAVLVISG